MLARIYSATLFGIDAAGVTVEVDARNGLPKELLVGLPDAVVRESRDRVKTAIQNADFVYPPKVYTINLAPAELRKEGAYLDLPIAVGILAATGQIGLDLSHTLIVGELALSGDVLPVRGIVPICLLAKDSGMSQIVLPAQNLAEAQMIGGIDWMPLTHIREIANVFSNPKPNTGRAIPRPAPALDHFQIDQVRGQHSAKRALEIAAAGQHNILLVGSPGCGKTMLIRCLPQLVGPMAESEAIEVLKIASAAGERKALSFDRPFRDPHHSVSEAGMVGGGQNPRPGEISLAHHGILFLDELPEYSRRVLELLRQPLESQQVTLSRAKYHITFPAQFLLAAAMNPCPCGYHNDSKKPCQCPPTVVARYWQRVSGPILDRFDLVVAVPRIQADQYFGDLDSSFRGSEMVKRLSIAQNRQRLRAGVNARLTQRDILKQHPLDASGTAFLKSILERGQVTGRGLDKVLRVSRTVADLADRDSITLDDLAEAMQFRLII